MTGAGGAGGWGVVTPTGAAGAGVGSAMATGWGAGRGRTTGLTTRCFTGVGAGSTTGFGRSTFGAGGSISWDSISIGTTIWAVRCNRPACSAHSAAMWANTTLPAMTALRLKPAAKGRVADRVMGTDEMACRQQSSAKTGFPLLAQNPPDRADDQNQAGAECCDEFHAPPQRLAGARMLAGVPLSSRLNAATGCEALHCATTSRAQPSHWPHWVATPSSS